MNLVPAENFLKILQWHPEDIVKFMLNYSQYSRLNPNSVALVEFDSIPKQQPTQTFVKDFGWLFAGNGNCRSKYLTNTRDTFNSIEENYPILNRLKFDNYVLAGSCPLLHCTQYLFILDRMDNEIIPGDLDFYLVAENEEEGFKVYNELLSEIDLYITNFPSLTSRNKNCTTITWQTLSMPSTTIQIIHRIFKTKQASVVGFDQTPCKVFYTKENGNPNIYYTLDAALALYFGINPIDWRRESQNHAMRYIKYKNYGFAPIFIGLPFPVKDELQQYHYYNLPGAGLKVEVLRHDRIIKAKNYKEEARIFHELELFTLDKHESDYGGKENLNVNSYQYHTLCMLVKEKLDYVCVLAEKNPLSIIDKHRELKIKDLLLKLYNNGNLIFYFGKEDGEDLHKYYTEKERISKKRILTQSELEELASLNYKIKSVIEKRTETLQARYDSVLEDLTKVKFNISNPGTQYTASFNPLFRKSPKDYWGPKCVPFEYDLNFKTKFTFYLTWKFGNVPYLRILNRDVIFLIFKWIDIEFFSEIISGKENTFTVKTKKHRKEWFELRKAKNIEVFQFKLPWEYNLTRKSSMKNYASRVIKDN